MGLGGCYSFIKFVLAFFNLIFLIVGLVGIVFSIWMLVDPTFSVSLTQEHTDYIISICIILIASILLTIVAFTGLHGALKQRQCALITFFSLLLIIVVAEVATGVWGYINQESLEASVRSAVKHTVEEEYEKNENRRLLFDTFQRKLQCCGYDKPSDWLRNEVLLSVSANPDSFKIPESCCIEGKSPEVCKKAISSKAGNIDYNVIYEKGCYTLIMNKLREHGCIILGVGIAIGVIQLLSLIFALILAFAINRANRYKA